MPITPIDTHVADAQDRILSQFQRPGVQAFVASMAQHVQTIENTVFSILNTFDLKTAVGSQLDTVAALVGVSRYGLSDDELRTLLYGIIALNNGNATAATIVAVAKALFQTDQVFFADGTAGKHGAQVGRSTIILGIGSTSLPDGALNVAKTLLAQAVGAGIRLLFVSSFVSGQAFACQGPQAWVQGYASVATPAAGGQMAGLYV